MNKIAKKWLIAYMNLIDGVEATCPKCGNHNLTYGYESAKKDDASGFGAVWCEDCRSAFILCRVIFMDEMVRKRIIDSLPADLKFD